MRKEVNSNSDRQSSFFESIQGDDKKMSKDLVHDDRNHTNHAKNKFSRRFFVSFVFFLLLGSGVASAYRNQQIHLQNLERNERREISNENNANSSISYNQNSNVEVNPVAIIDTSIPVTEKKNKKSVFVPTPAAEEAISQAPPIHTTPVSAPIVEETKSNTDGSTTTVIATAEGAKPADFQAITTPTTIEIDSPLDVSFSDETGLYPDLSGILKNYLNESLKWRNEISGLNKITIRDAGATGWAGQYLGQYTVAADGRDIISASGTIILNTYYYKSSPYFNDFMKLVLSHEYGHHYTLYHKWVDWDLTISERFPSSYYTSRPLSTTTTATDYSLGWENCEAEIIAEDYSYFYSGFSLQAMSKLYNFPAQSIKSWLDNIGDPSLLSVALPIEIDTEKPVIRIVSPDTSPYALITNNITLEILATDNFGIDKTEAYLNDELRGTYQASNLRLTINFANFGTYNLKFRSYDRAGNFGETTFVVIYAPPILPTNENTNDAL
ncbi:MAG: Ig-like domain-containing protein [bacterium]